MVKAYVTTSAFTAGELSPRVLGRTDIERYGQGLKRCRNAHAVIQGGVKRRSGSRYLAAAGSATPRMSVLVPFVAGRDESWMLEFSGSSVKVFNADGTAAGVTLTTPYSDVHIGQLDWAQSDRTMYLFHPLYPVARLQRLAGGSWVFGYVQFTQQPFAELPMLGSGTLVLSAATVGAGRTFTTAVANFMASDVGRAVIAGPGIGVITAYVSATQVTVEITRAFTSTTIASTLWEIEGSPQTTCNPAAASPVGTIITVHTADDAWRSTDAGSLIRINGGLLRITTVTSATHVQAIILRELSGASAAPALSWSLEREVWNGYAGYPRTGTVYQQRLICAGTSRFPRTVWGSRIGEFLDFELWTNDNDAFAFTIDADDSAPIAWVNASTALMVLTEGGEFSMRGGVEKPITPTNVRVSPESNHGSSGVRPVSVNRETMFVQRAGKKVRALGYRYDSDGYSAPDVTALAEHLTAVGVVGMAYQQEPELLLWAIRSDGKLLSCTFDRDQQPSVVAWAMHDLGGQVESIAAAPNGDTDQLWMIVRRVIDGETVRYVEMLQDDWIPLHPSMQGDEPLSWGYTVDCGIVIDSTEGTNAILAAHLAGEVVDVVADGAKQPPVTLDAFGAGTLVRNAKRILVGLPFATELTLLQPEFGTESGSSHGQPSRTSELTIKFLNTIGGKVRNVSGELTTLPVRRLSASFLNNPPQPLTGNLSVTVTGWTREGGDISLLQDDPMPMHVLSVTRRHTVNGG